MSIRRFENERGATAMVVAISLLLIMGIAAIALDGGLGLSEKRQAQSGVDFGALAALQAATSCPSPCSVQAAADNGATEAILVTNNNLPGRTLDWGTCSDPNRPAEFTVVSTVSPCVSFTNNLDKSRVYLPDDDIDTTFGKLLGANFITVKAFAEAGMELTQSATIIPHTPTGTVGSQLCLFSNQAPQTVPPCDGAVSGFYGYLDAALYGSDLLGTPSTCANGNSNLRLAINMAKGGDHSLVTYDFGPPADPVVNDHAACPITPEDVNEVRVQTGSPTGGITDGLINGVSGAINGSAFTASPGRIICDLSPGGYSSMCASIRGVSLDHTGLWEFLTPGSCPGTDTHAEMIVCLDSGSASFTSAVATHPRFAAVPILWPNPPATAAPDGPGNYKIQEFAAVWIETLYFNCNANRCNTVHSPGETFSPPGPAPGQPPACGNPIDPVVYNCGWSHTSGNDDVEAMVALRIPLSSLPADVTDTFPSTQTSKDFALTR